MNAAQSRPKAGPGTGPAVLAAELRVALMRTVRRLRAEKSDADLTDAQYSVLALLDRSGPRTPGEIATHERVQPPRRLARPPARRPDPRRARRPRPLRRDPEEDRRLVSPTFRSLHVHNYRLWASGAIVSNTGTWMQRVAQDWLVLTVLTANSGTAVGITTGLQFAPALLLSPAAGALADRMDRRKLLVATQTASGALALGLGLLVTGGLAQLWHVYGFALLLGVVSAVDGPARQAFVSELVPTADLPNAVGLNSASFHGGRLIGPGIAGLLIHWFGTGPVFLINAVSFGAVVISLLRMRTGELRAVPRRERGGHPVREGLTYVRRRSDIVLTLVIIGMVGTFGLNFQITTALMARLVFHKGAGEYGLLGSVMAVGSLAGALLAARREHPRLRLVLGATIAFGVFAGIAALMPTYTLFALALIPVGLSSLT